MNLNGLDPIGISELRDMFIKLNKERGITSIISSHILSELYMVANNFMFIDKGKVLKDITKEELDLECMRCIAIKTDDIKHASAVIEQELCIFDYKIIDSNELRIYDKNIKSDTLNKFLIQNDVSISAVFETGISLKDYFKSNEKCIHILN